MTAVMLATLGATMLAVGFIFVSLLLVGLVLLQKNRGSGLSGAFGGVGGHSAFGTKTGDFLTWLTVGLTAVFLLLAIVGNFIFVPTPLAPATPPAPISATPPADTGAAGDAAPIDTGEAPPPAGNPSP